MVITEGTGAPTLVPAIVSTMRDIHYKNKNIRLAEEIWAWFKAANKQSGKSWNLFIKELLEASNYKPKNVTKK